jgi:arylsulfatase A-like enzyme
MDGSPAAVRRARELADRRPGVATEVDLQLARLYAGEVSYLDQEVGRLLEALATAGRFEDALIVITADHGETFWEHGDRWSHGHATYETTVRVPLMLRLPRGAHAGVRVTTPVSGVDLMPTLLELAGLATPPGLDGESLVPTLSGRELSRTGSFSQGPLPAGRLERETRRWTNERKAQSVRSGSWKLVRLPAGRGEELYDLARDPGEQHDLAASDDPDTRRRKAELAGALSAWNEAADPFPSEFFPRRRATDGPDAEARRAMWERLRALGYVTDDDEPGSDP